MGDRANVVIKETYQEKTNYVFLYTHWRGQYLPHLVQAALQRRLRWDDEYYLARIIFDGMTDGEQGEETGFGIGTTIRDNQHKLIVVDPENMCIGFTVGNDYVWDTCMDTVLEDVQSWWSFGEYCDLTIEEIRKAYE